MNRSRKIQFALGAILLWSSTTVSSLAATNINPGKNQLNTVNFPVESTPSTQLNLTPDSNLIAGNGDDIYMIALDDETDDHHDDIVAWEDALKKPDGKKIILEYCPSKPPDKLRDCWEALELWSDAKIIQIRESYNRERDNHRGRAYLESRENLKFLRTLSEIREVASSEFDRLRQ